MKLSTIPVIAVAALMPLFSIQLTAPQEASAQTKLGIDVNERALAELERELRVSPQEFVGWLVEHSMIGKAGGDAPAEYTFFALFVNQEGEIAERIEQPVKVQPGDTRIFDQVDGREMGELMARLVPNDYLVMDGRSWIGSGGGAGSGKVSTRNDAFAYAERFARVAYDEKGIVGQNGYGILMMALPAKERFEDIEIEMGLFIAWI